MSKVWLSYKENSTVVARIVAFRWKHCSHYHWYIIRLNSYSLICQDTKSLLIFLDVYFQEIDLATGTVGTIQSGNRKLLGKSTPIQTMQVHDGFLYTASSSIEGPAVKVFSFLGISSLVLNGLKSLISFLSYQPPNMIFSGFFLICFITKNQIFIFFLNDHLICLFHLMTFLRLTLSWIKSFTSVIQCCYRSGMLQITT